MANFCCNTVHFIGSDTQKEKLKTLSSGKDGIYEDSQSHPSDESKEERRNLNVKDHWVWG